MASLLASFTGLVYDHHTMADQRKMLKRYLGDKYAPIIVYNQDMYRRAMKLVEEDVTNIRHSIPIETPAVTHTILSYIIENSPYQPQVSHIVPDCPTDFARDLLTELRSKRSKYKKKTNLNKYDVPGELVEDLHMLPPPWCGYAIRGVGAINWDRAIIINPDETKNRISYVSEERLVYDAFIYSGLITG